nr:MAG TPA: hypothetical protein [Caudoviricetes sp.]
MGMLCFQKLKQSLPQKSQQRFPDRLLMLCLWQFALLRALRQLLPGRALSRIP